MQIDLPALLNDLATGDWSANWTEDDQRRDFQAVFSGTADRRQAERVLLAVLARCNVFGTLEGRPDIHEQQRRLGEREIGVWLLNTMFRST